MAARTPHKTGTVGQAARQGKYYFIHRSSRLVRVDDFQTLPIPLNNGWEHVSLERWEAFRKETKKMNPKVLAELHRSYRCCSTTPSPSAKSSTLKETSTKPSAKKSSPKRERQSEDASAPSKPKSSKPSSNKGAKLKEKPAVSSKPSPMIRQPTRNSRFK